MSETLPALATRGPADLIEWGKSAIERAASFIAVKDIRDQAEALRAYQSSVGAAQEAVDAAQEIRIRAERRMGQEIARAQHEGSAATPHRRQKGSDAPTLSELGVSKHHSSEWQQLAAVDNETFETVLSAAKERHSLSPSAVRNLLRERRTKTKTDQNRRLSKNRSAKSARRHIISKPPTAEEEVQRKVFNFSLMIQSCVRLIEQLGRPSDVLDIAAKPSKHPGRIHFDPKELHRIADFLTALAAAMDAVRGTSGAEIGEAGEARP
jgi:hypothetical protein